MLTHKFNSFFCCHQKLLKSTFRKKNSICLLTTNFCNETNNVKDSDSLSNSLLLLIEDHKIDNPQELSKIEENAKRRGCKSDVKNLYSMWEKFKNTSDNENNRNILLKEIHKELLLLPNSTCPNCEDLVEPKVIRTFGKKRDLLDALTLEQLSHHGVQTTMTGNFTGRRSYYLRGSMAQLEAKLVRYAIQELQKKGFEVMSVPDIVHEDVLSSCGVPLERDRTLVYRLDAASVGGDPQACLSGTAEMAIGGWLRNRNFNISELPLRLCSVSRCFRAEANSTHEEHGIFRVHNFTKVEMFGVTANETGRESEELYQELVALQQQLLEGLGLHGQVVLMPPFELGKPAHSKTDMEVWLPGRGRYAELTSASNCLAYQAARLGATYTDPRSNRRKLVHTVNGTALAVPRCIIALCETHQEEGGRRAIRMPRKLGLTALHQSGQENDVGDEQLEKIMVYKEQCVRKVLPSRHLELLIQE